MTEALKVRFPTEPPIDTQFDIVEDCTTPILMSVGQMQNLEFNLKLRPWAGYLTSEPLGIYDKQLPLTNTRRYAFDLSSIRVKGRTK